MPETHNGPDIATGLDIAVVAMTGRFPGARNLQEFWENLCNGYEMISSFLDEELLASEVSAEALKSPFYVKRGAVLEHADLFDAQFFDFNPREAEIIDPQHRLFLECAWEALELAGCNPDSYPGLVGVYAGTGMNAYLRMNVLRSAEIREKASDFQLMISNDKDFLPTRVSYKMNLRGPSVNIQSACSTSLVAIHMACQSLLSYQCDLALSGGVSILLPQKQGYIYQEGGILSPDGHCRAFDIKAAGTVFGSAVGVVVLKRLTEALADGDNIYAVIRGSAINNDGSLKAGYTAPSVDGQAEVIANAQAVAGVAPETISYIETHGTGTAVGDPIEIAALTKAFRAGTQRRNFCAIGSIKTNIGHTDVAAGVVGLIKTVLALKHKQIPASLHFEKPNPQIDFAASPFYVNTQLSEWKTNGDPRRAGVSSFGIGGTNAHVILEEAPEREKSSESRPWKLLLLSARTATALETATANLARHLRDNPDVNLPDVAYTLQVGRKTFNHRCMLVCSNIDDALGALQGRDPRSVFSAVQERRDRAVAFMFPGQGAQYVQMGRDLYRSEPIFRQHVDACAELLKVHLNLDLRDVLYPDETGNENGRSIGKEKLQQTRLAQPALFVIGYALAKLWMDWGIKPRAMIGHSVGEYVAACLAGVFSLEDALALLAARGRLMQSLPGGAMLSVGMGEEEIGPCLGKQLSVAAINGPGMSVISGPVQAVEALEAELNQTEVPYQRLHTSHAFHSAMMDPILEPFTRLVEKIKLQPPAIPYISNITGTWISAADLGDPGYWARHLREAVRFADGVQELMKDSTLALLEVGPGQTLTTLARCNVESAESVVAFSSLRRPQEQQSDVAFIVTTLGRLWLAGVPIDWSGFYSRERRHRVLLPTYPFERQRYWVEAQGPSSLNDSRRMSSGKKSDVADWFYVPLWKQSIMPQKQAHDGPKLSWLLFVDECGVGAEIGKRLKLQGHNVAIVHPGEKFTRLEENRYAINPQSRADYDALFNEFAGDIPRRIVHLWNVNRDQPLVSNVETLDRAEQLGFYSLMFLAQALGEQRLPEPVQIVVMATNIQAVSDEDVVYPEKAIMLGPCKVIPLEYPNISCRCVDIVVPSSSEGKEEIERLMHEIAIPSPDVIACYRRGQRYVQFFEPVRLDRHPEVPLKLEHNGVYLITGGLGGIGLVFAECLVRMVKAKLVLVGRSAMPPRETWEDWLAAHPVSDRTSRKIRKLQELNTQGSEILVASADVSNWGEMKPVIDLAKQRFGAIDGVIHAAGIAGSGVIALKTPETAAQVLAPKVRGTVVLHNLLKDLSPKLVVLCSSINSIVPAPGQVDYCAANAFQDSFARRHYSRNGTCFVSINWDTWAEVGMAVETPVPAALEKQREERLLKGILSQEGVEAFCRILGSSEAQVIVATEDFRGRSKGNEPLVSTTPNLLEDVSLISSHSRPEISDTYAAPRNETEQILANVWSKLLGLNQIGIHDNFFELGGHSLLATQVVSRIRDGLNVKMALRDLFERPTVAGLADRIETMLWAKKNIDSNGPMNDREEIEL